MLHLNFDSEPSLRYILNFQQLVATIAFLSIGKKKCSITHHERVPNGHLFSHCYAPLSRILIICMQCNPPPQVVVAIVNVRAYTEFIKGHNNNQMAEIVAMVTTHGATLTTTTKETEISRCCFCCCRLNLALTLMLMSTLIDM